MGVLLKEGAASTDLVVVLIQEMNDANIVFESNDIRHRVFPQRGKVIRLGVDCAEKVLGEANRVDLVKLETAGDWPEIVN